MIASQDVIIKKSNNFKVTLALSIAISGAITVNLPQHNNIVESSMFLDNIVENKSNNLLVLPGIDFNPLRYNNGNISNFKEGEIMEEMQKMRTNNLEKLDSFLLFHENWNGYGAMPLSEKLISKVKGVIFALNYQPEVFPTACDSIQFEYEKENGEYLEFELFEDEIIKVFKIDKWGNENTVEYKFDFEKVNKEIKNFYEC